MKNMVVLALFLFIASVSFVGCDGDDGATGLTGEKGIDGLVGPSGLEQLAEDLEFTENQHVDSSGDALLACDADGWHAHADDGVCYSPTGFNANGLSIHGCTEDPLQEWNSDVDGNGVEDDGACQAVTS